MDNNFKLKKRSGKQGDNHIGIKCDAIKSYSKIYNSHGIVIAIDIVVNPFDNGEQTLNRTIRLDVINTIVEGKYNVKFCDINYVFTCN